MVVAPMYSGIGHLSLTTASTSLTSYTWLHAAHQRSVVSSRSWLA